ncbi:helix-turn-helix transcriptional regulator [Actinoplanes sp. CA-030573]|uniref:helix-turn-helix transcriptional regulator n=1 Tax=Actinoplanes sp. CA-030573 TaxID=3239898 RepID=UPI003D9079E4
MTGWIPPPLPEQWKRAASRPLVGREGALAVLDEAWTAVLAGARQAVFVGGDAGTGKSRLAAEAAVVLHDAGATVLIGACVADLGHPYQPFIEPLAGVLEAYDSGALAESPPEIAPGGRPVVSWLHALASEDLDVADTTRAFQRQLCQAAVLAIRTMARAGPILMILEDLHWSGPAGQQLLTYVVQHTADCRLLILATYRDAPPDRSAPLVQTVAALQGAGGVRRIDLEPLRAEDIATWLRGEGGLTGDRAEETAGYLRRQTGGNPYFVQELWRDLRSRRTMRPLDETAAPPVSVRDALQSRMHRLLPEQVEVASLAAVIGEEVEPAILLAAGRWPERTVLTAVDACVHAGLMLPIADDGVFRFAHALARQSVLDFVPASVRMQCHANIAVVIERMPAIRHRVRRLAHHYASAHPLGFTEQAVHFLIEAAKAAAAGLAHRDAGRLYERAAALMTAPADRDEALLEAVTQHVHANDFVRARELAEQVARTGEPRQRLRAAIAFEAASWRPGLPGHMAVNLLRRALTAVPDDPADHDRVRATAALGRALAFTGERELASRSITAAIDMARATGDESLVMEALSAGLWERRSVRFARTVRERAAEVSELARARGDLVTLGPGAHYLAMAAYLAGEPDQMDAAYRELASVAYSTGQAYFEYFAHGVEYGRQFIRADFAAAGRTCAAQLKLGLSFGTDETNGPFGVQTFMLRRESGGLDRVRAMINGDEDPAAFWAPGLLALYTEFGMDDAAGRLMRWILDHEALCDPHSAQWPMVLVFLTEAALALRDTSTAADLRPALAEYAGLNLVAEPFVALFGSADRYIGAVDSLLGRGDPDESLAAALRLDTRTGSPLHVAHTLAATIHHRRRAGSDESAIQQIADRARGIAEPLRLRRVLRALPAPVREERPVDRVARGSYPAGLTAREVEVLALISTGLGNREIARRLFITENTAANHVRSILSKTGARNRTQAARYAADHGLLS